MRPTADDALDGAERLLRSLVAEGSLGAADADPVLALLQRARVPSERLTFLDKDNRTMRTLLDALRPSLPRALSSEVSSHVHLAPSAPLLDLVEADRVNVGLRELLARAIRALPVSAQDDRDRLLGYLQHRVALDPSSR